MSINFKDASKAKKLRDYFYDKGRIYIVVDATRDEVNVPDFLKGDPGLRLVLNTRMPQPIYIRDATLESSFSFSGVAHACVVPMHCIWAAYQPESDVSSGLIWDDAIPEAVRAIMGTVGGSAGESNELPISERVVPTLDKSDGSEKKGRKVTHLRVVK